MRPKLEKIELNQKSRARVLYMGMAGAGSIVL